MWARAINISPINARIGRLLSIVHLNALQYFLEVVLLGIGGGFGARACRRDGSVPRAFGMADEPSEMDWTSLSNPPIDKHSLASILRLREPFYFLSSSVHLLGAAS